MSKKNDINQANNRIRTMFSIGEDISELDKYIIGYGLFYKKLFKSIMSSITSQKFLWQMIYFDMKNYIKIELFGSIDSLYNL